MTAITESPKVHNTIRTRRVPFSELHEPGCYISNSTGNLFRVPEDALALNRSPLIEIVSNTGTMMTRVSDDPWIPISKARQLAADTDLAINF